MAARASVQVARRGSTVRVEKKGSSAELQAERTVCASAPPAKAETAWGSGAARRAKMGAQAAPPCAGAAALIALARALSALHCPGPGVAILPLARANANLN